MCWAPSVSWPGSVPGGRGVPEEHEESGGAFGSTMGKGMMGKEMHSGKPGAGRSWLSRERAA